jgi:hypothetical protein
MERMMNDERQQFEKPTKPSPAGPVTHRAILRRRRRGFSGAGHAWMRLGMPEKPENPEEPK